MTAYVKLLLKERLLVFRPSPGKKPRKGGKIKAVLAIVGFSLLALMVYATLVALEYFAFQGFVAIGSPDGFLAAVFLLCMILTLVTGFFYVVSALFFSRDILFVSALPISSRGLLSAKLLMVLLGEAGVALLICLPAVVLYGLHVRAGLWLYVKALLFVPFLPVAPMMVVVLLAFLLIRVSALWKRREGMTTVMIFAVMVVFMGVQMTLSMNMSDAAVREWLLKFFLRNLDVVDMLARMFPPIRWICHVFLAEGVQGWLYGVLLVVVSMGAAALLVFVLGGGYQALAVRQSETLTRMNAHKRQRGKSRESRSPLMAIYLRELKEIFIVPAYATNCLAPLVMFPVMLGAMLLSTGNNAELAALLPLLTLGLTKGTYLAMATAALSLTGCMNMAVSTAISREGKRHEFSRILPVAPGVQIFGKLLMGLTLNFANALTTGTLLWFVFPRYWVQTLMALILSTFFSLASCMLGLMLDTSRPNFNWKTETEAVKRSMNGVLAMLGSLVLLGLMIGLFFLLKSIEVKVEWALLAAVLVTIVTNFLLLIGLKNATKKHFLYI